MTGAFAAGESGAVLNHTLQVHGAAAAGCPGDADQPGCPRQPYISGITRLPGEYAGGHITGARPEIDAALRYGGGVSRPGTAWQPGFGAEMQHARPPGGRGCCGSGGSKAGGGPGGSKAGGGPGDAQELAAV